MTTATVDLLRRRVRYLEGKIQQVQVTFNAIRSIESQRGSLPAARQVGADRASAQEMGPPMRDMLTASDSLRELTTQANRTRLAGSSEATSLFSQANSLLQTSDRLAREWRARPEYAYDEINAGWFTRQWRQLNERGTYSAGGGTAFLPGAGSPQSGSGEKDPWAGRERNDSSSWGWIIGGVAVTAVVAGGAAIFFGVQDRGRIAARKRTGKKLETHRDSLRKGK